jgi:hypothetical protein
VQDSILVPSFTLDVAGADGDLWQRIGGYPIPPFLSRDTEETSKIAIEVGGKKLGAAIPAPMQVAVRAPERAAMKADVDVRVYGADPKVKHTLIVAHGRPPEAGKPISFRPTVKELDPAAPMVSMGIDLSGLPREAFPAQVFVWHHVALEWKPAGGFLPPDQPLASGEGSKPARRSMLVHPASHPHLRFIRFEGGAPDLDGGRGILGLAGFVPMGGVTLGRGGPLTPFSNQVNTSVIVRDEDDRDERWSRPHTYRGEASANANSNATATAMAFNFCNCGGGKGNPCDPKGGGPGNGGPGHGVGPGQGGGPGNAHKPNSTAHVPYPAPDAPTAPDFGDKTSGPDSHRPGDAPYFPGYAEFTPDVQQGYQP